MRSALLKHNSADFLLIRFFLYDKMIQAAAETAYDMVSPGTLSIEPKKIKRFPHHRLAHQPVDLREGVAKAYSVVKEVSACLPEWAGQSQLACFLAFSTLKLAQCLPDLIYIHLKKIFIRLLCASKVTATVKGRWCSSLAHEDTSSAGMAPQCSRVNHSWATIGPWEIGSAMWFFL